MQSFMYTVKAPVGLHARHAGIIVKAAREFESDIRVEFNGRAVDGKRILTLMGLGIKQGDLIRVTAEGPDEDAAAIALKRVIWENF